MGMLLEGIDPNDAIVHFPVKIAGKTHDPEGKPYHITVRWGKWDGTKQELIQKVREAIKGLSTKRPKITEWRPEIFHGKNGDKQFHVLRISIDTHVRELYDALSAVFGPSDFPHYKAHVTVERELWDRINDKMLLPGDIGVQVLPLEVAMGNATLEQLGEDKESRSIPHKVVEFFDAWDEYSWNSAEKMLGDSELLAWLGQFKPVGPVVLYRGLHIHSEMIERWTIKGGKTDEGDKFLYSEKRHSSWSSSSETAKKFVFYGEEGETGLVLQSSFSPDEIICDIALIPKSIVLEIPKLPRMFGEQEVIVKPGSHQVEVVYSCSHTRPDGKCLGTLGEDKTVSADELLNAWGAAQGQKGYAKKFRDSQVSGKKPPLDGIVPYVIDRHAEYQVGWVDPEDIQPNLVKRWDQPMADEEESWAQKYAALSADTAPPVVLAPATGSDHKWKVVDGRHRVRAAAIRGGKVKAALPSVKENVDSLIDAFGIPLIEAERKLNKPFRTPHGPKKFSVYVKDPKTGNDKKVNFGDPKMEIRRDDPERRKNFRARHKCDQQKDKTKAGYWSCKFWSDKSVSDLLEKKQDQSNIEYEVKDLSGETGFEISALKDGEKVGRIIAAEEYNGDSSDECFAFEPYKTEPFYDDVCSHESFVIIQLLEVDPEARGEGVATGLMQRSMKEIEKRFSGTPVFINASPMGTSGGMGLEALVQFYQKFGFKVLKKYPQFRNAALWREDIDIWGMPVTESIPKPPFVSTGRFESVSTAKIVGSLTGDELVPERKQAVKDLILAEEFDWKRMPVQLVQDGDKYWVGGDGKHRVAVAKELGLDSVYAEVFVRKTSDAT